MKFPESGAQRTRSRTIGWRRHAQGSGRQSGHADGVARHVEELDRVAFFGNTRHDVPLHDSADVAGPKTVLGNIAGEPPALFGAQGHHRVDSRRATRGDEAGNE